MSSLDTFRASPSTAVAAAGVMAACRLDLQPATIPGWRTSWHIRHISVASLTGGGSSAAAGRPIKEVTRIKAIEVALMTVLLPETGWNQCSETCEMGLARVDPGIVGPRNRPPSDQRRRGQCGLDWSAVAPDGDRYKRVDRHRNNI
jgi:hypothetical protein